jgi:shikimate kinase
MGAGKTSVGRALGQLLNWDFEDLDDRIERHEGRTVGEIFRVSGEETFREAEHNALQQALAELSGGKAKIVALGGGAFVQRKNATLLADSGLPTVFLDAPVEDLWQRCSKQAQESGAERPLLQSREKFEDLYQARRKSYAKAAFMISTCERDVDSIASEIARKLRLRKIATRVEQGEAE